VIHIAKSARSYLSVMQSDLKGSKITGLLYREGLQGDHAVDVIVQAWVLRVTLCFVGSERGMAVFLMPRPRFLYHPRPSGRYKGEQQVH